MQKGHGARDHHRHTHYASDQRYENGVVFAKPAVRHDGTKDGRKKCECVKGMVDHCRLVRAERQLARKVDDKYGCIGLECVILYMYGLYIIPRQTPRLRPYNTIYLLFIPFIATRSKNMQPIRKGMERG